MDSGKKYSVSEIAEKLGVPRTTVTDWLSRYSQYIEFRLQGKRKVYTEAAVNALKEISTLRNQGLSSFRIEEELREHYPGHGEAAIQKISSDKDIPGYDGDFSRVIKRNQISETGMKTSLESYTNYRYIFALLFLVFLFLCAGIIAFLKVEAFIRENQKLDIEAKNSISRLKNADDNSKENRMDVYDLGKQVSELASSPMAESRKAENLEEQKDEFKKSILKMEQTAQTAKEAEILLLRNKFAEERLELLKALDAARKNREEMEAIITQIQAQCYEQSMTLEKFSEKTKR